MTIQNITIFEGDNRLDLLPFTYTRPIADIRCGILTARERWELLLCAKTQTLTPDSSLQDVFPLINREVSYLIDGSVLATAEMATAVKALLPGQQLADERGTIAILPLKPVCSLGELQAAKDASIVVPFHSPVSRIHHPWDIFRLNGAFIRSDFDIITHGRTGAPIPPNVMVSSPEQLFIEQGAEIGMGVIINAAKGPVYISCGAVVLEGAMIHGPMALGEHAVIKMGAKIYGETTIGPGCKVGGEVSNVVFFANSNKGHDGYLGNSVVGEWCNLGADTNSSNLKNNYDEVKVFSEAAGKLVPTGLLFCGLLMADHAKCAINTMFNTGTVVGVSANIFGSGFPDKFLPGFSWGGAGKLETYDFNKAMETAARMMMRRGKSLTGAETALLRSIFDATQKQRDQFS